jgi:hypothetical protein
MIRLGKWATVVAGAVMVLTLAAAAQEQAAEQTIDSTVQTSADPAAPTAGRFAVEESPVEESPAEESPVEEAAAEEPPVEEPLVEEAPPVPSVTQFLDINDAVPGRFFNAGATAPDGADPNRLVIAFHSGIDWTTWKNTDFRASTESFSYTTATDTISFRIEAPKGFYIARITYSQGGRGSALRLGKAAGSAQWVVASVAAPLGVFGTNPALKGEADLTGLGMTSVPVSITNGFFASAPPAAGSAILEVNSAEVQVFLEPLTNP